jgi:UDP-N-acetylglucosamine 2-epimerase
MAEYYKDPELTKETIQSGWNRLAPPCQADIKAEIEKALCAKPTSSPKSYGNGNSAEEICRIMLNYK